MNDELVGVYNADGGLLGELAYVAGKVTGKSHCALCDTTHGANPFGKRSWKDAAACSPIPIRTVHRNEMDERTAQALADVPTPAVVLLSDEGDRVFLDHKDLQACGKEPQALLQAITEKLGQ